MKIYGSVWFRIKIHPFVKFRAIHKFNLSEKSRQLHDRVCKINDPVILRNVCFSHRENLLISMILYERAHIGQLAFQRLLKARKEKKRKIGANFSATDHQFCLLQITLKLLIDRIANLHLL